MKKIYDIIYLTNTPSFYKLNLCQKIAEKKSVLLVFFGYGSEAVNTIIESRNWSFQFKFINNGDSNKRNKFKTFKELLKLMRRVNGKKILFSGWLAPEYNLFAFLSPKHKNVCVCESSLLDSYFTGFKGKIKKLIINRMATALPSGKPHDDLFNSIGFKGTRRITGSVGIFNKSQRNQKKIHNPLRYIYVGRLVDVKNVQLLIDTFNNNGKPLTIVGDGPLRSELQSTAKPNIQFIGFVDNELLGPIYQNADIFILPSKYEPWGLVVEEAIYWGLPVIVSDRVGSGYDMVASLGTGEIFESENQKSLQEKIDLIEKDFDKYKKAVDEVDFNERDKNQVSAYLDL